MGRTFVWHSKLAILVVECVDVPGLEPTVIAIRPRIVFVVTEDWYFWSHRLDLARAARDTGYDVTIATRVSDHRKQIEHEGFRLAPLRLSRESRNPLHEWVVLIDLIRLYRALRPDIVHHVAMKPIVYGSLAAWMAGVPAVVNAFAGLGYAFTGEYHRGWAVPFVLKHLLKLAITPAKTTALFQNKDDRDLMIQYAVVRKEQARIISGSGVNTDQFIPVVSEFTSGPPIVMLPSRMLWDKGIAEFVGAAQFLRASGVNARFVLVGRCDSQNPAAIAPRQLQAWTENGAVEWWGHRDDMPAVLAMATIAVLPSYREGLPKALLEAAACGKPLIATDVPGCREVVRDKITGLLVPPRNAEALAQAISSLLADPEARAAMGRAGREMVVREYSTSRIAGETLALYRELLAAQSPAAHLQALV
jgi:glycosyltransferase involved in cell wall biosynthesis